MKKPISLIVIAVLVLVAPSAFAQPMHHGPIHDAIRKVAARGELLSQAGRGARIPGSSCGARVRNAIVIGAALGALVGGVTYTGNRDQGVVLGGSVGLAFGAVVGWKSC